MKIQFLGPSRGKEGRETRGCCTPFWAVFSFFLLLFFFSRFLSFIFLFLFISSFFDFQKFFIFHFFRRKSFFFSFFWYFFQIFFLLALVSEFNCFLRSRCSMDMWCPDDRGRDSWDWVGPPAWGRACFNSPEWGGGSSPVKTEPPQIVLLMLLLLFGTRLDVCVWSLHTGQCRTQSLRPIGGRSPGSQTPSDPATPEPSTTKNSSSSRAPKKSPAETVHS